MKKIIIIMLYIITSITFIIIGFVNLSPQFGSNPPNKDIKSFTELDNFKDGEFMNLEETEMMTGEMPMSEFFKKDSSRRPQFNLKPKKINLESFIGTAKDSIMKFAWLGHSAFIFNINGKIILLDPMLGKHAAPLPVPSMKRYSDEIAFSLDDIITIDAVLISHDHYDHLDYPTIKKLRSKVKMFYVPLGVGSHLLNWGIKKENIIEMNWNDERQLGEIDIFCLPARHFSGRGPLNRNSTLWSSWALKSRYGKIYFSGDSGFGSHLFSIGKQHGPFDLALIDCGQYNKAWKNTHMFPKEAVQASKALQAKHFMPIHWGAFTLSTHSWTEPIEQALNISKEMKQKIITPQIGEVLSINKLEKENISWWVK